MAPETPTIDLNLAFLTIGPDFFSTFGNPLGISKEFNLSETFSAAPKPLGDEDEDEDDEDEDEDDDLEDDEDSVDEEDEEEEEDDEDDDEDEDEDDVEPLVTKRR